MSLVAMPGGGLFALTTSESYIDLSAFEGRTVMVCCDEQDFWYCAAADGTSTGTLVTAAPQAASTTALVGRRIRAGWSRPLFIRNTHSVLIAKTASSTGTLRITPISDVGERAEGEGHPASGATGTTTPAARSATLNTTYIVSGDMSADINGPAISTGVEGILTAQIIWAATGTAIGTISLQALMPDGVTWKDIPGASAEFTAQPNNSAGDLLCVWTGLRAFGSVRIKYTRTSGGTANTSFNVDTSVQ